MSMLWDLVKGIPEAAVLRERVALADQKYDRALEEAEELRQKVADLEREVTELRKQLPSEPTGDISEDTAKVLVHLFMSEDEASGEVRAIASQFNMENSVAEYHLERLDEHKLASPADYNPIDGTVNWELTTDGRRYVVEHGLVPK